MHRRHGRQVEGDVANGNLAAHGTDQDDSQGQNTHQAGKRPQADFPERFASLLLSLPPVDPVEQVEQPVE